MVHIMSKMIGYRGECKRCNLKVMDKTMICPLCKSVVELNSEVKKEIAEEHIASNGLFESKSVMYPDIKPAIKKMRFLIKLIVFISIFVEAVLISINYNTYNGVKWSLITGAGLAYLCFTLAYSAQFYAGHKKKMFAQFVAAIILVLIIDYSIGYHGWALDLGIPIAIMLIDVSVVVLMLVNRMHWQSYIMLQIGIILVSFFNMILVSIGVVKHAIPSTVAAVLTVMILVGTLIFGDKRATNELSRRFRV